MEFARTLYRAGVRDFGIIKASRGGGGNSFWLKHPTNDDHMYEHVTNTVAAATADLTANGHTFEIVGLLYLQGESDNSSEAAAAGTRLKLLSDNLRAGCLSETWRKFLTGLSERGYVDSCGPKSLRESFWHSIRY